MFTSLGDGVELGWLDPWYAEEYLAAIDTARDYLQQWVPFPSVTVDVDGARAHLQRFADGRARDTEFYFGIWVHGALVGGVMVFGFSTRLGTCEVGVWLLPEAQGRGIVTRATRYVIDWLFRVRGVSRVQWTNNPANAASRAVAQRLGMTREGLLRSAFVLNGVRSDSELWSVLAEEWPAAIGQQ